MSREPGVPPLDEGWYLLSTDDLELVLHGSGRSQIAALPELKKLSIDEALAYRAAGNLPDANDRSLRLVLHVSGLEDLKNLQKRRLLYEPDFHEAPKWRRPGSRPVNIVPLRVAPFHLEPAEEWWADEHLARLEAEWAATGLVAGVRVPAAYRGFVYKTVLELQSAGAAVTVESIADSIARWLSHDQAEEIRRALQEANEGMPGL